MALLTYEVALAGVIIRAYDRPSRRAFSTLFGVAVSFLMEAPTR